jgi:uncharacterized membrane protein
MNLQPLVEAPLAIQLHVATIVPAFVIGTWLIFFSTKGSRYHRLAGKTYLALMVLTSLAAVFVRSFSGWSLAMGPLSLGLIHLFVPLTLHGVWGTLAALRAGDVKGHQASMRGVYFGAIAIAGLLAFAPGRIMFRMFFG